MQFHVFRNHKTDHAFYSLCFLFLRTTMTGSLCCISTFWCLVLNYCVCPIILLELACLQRTKLVLDLELQIQLHFLWVQIQLVFNSVVGLPKLTVWLLPQQGNQVHSYPSISLACHKQGSETCGIERPSYWHHHLCFHFSHDLKEFLSS